MRTIPENMPDMEAYLGGLIKPLFMEKFREGPYTEASSSVQKTWLLVMTKFLPKICKGWGKKMTTNLLSEFSETTVEMEALVCWYVDMYGDSRWAPEHKADEERREKGETLVRRGRREGVTAKEKRQLGPQLFVKYLKMVKERRGESKDWEQAVKNLATKESELDRVDDSEENVQPKKKQRKGEAETVIPLSYVFTDDGKVVPYEV